MTKTYYRPDSDTSENNRLSPAPQISLSTELNYSGDTIIGYIHKVNLRGYATAYRKTTASSEPKVSAVGITHIMDSVAQVKEALSRNGGNLIVIDEDNKTVLKAKGGILRSLSFNESPNGWADYSEYTAELEFNEVELMRGSSLKTIQCSDSFLDTNSQSNNIVDISKYKIKSFTDNWSISTDENLYNRVFVGDFGNLDTDNATLNLSYNISATGKHFFINDKLIPAWEQAKNFAQDRLYKQVTAITTSALGIDKPTACAATHTLPSLGTSTDGALSNLSDYTICNETVTCDTSESDGAFTATYTAILKRNQPSAFSHPLTKHTFTKNITRTDYPSRPLTTISVQGSIEGLIVGGIINSGGKFQLPQNGSILIGSTNSPTKYANALAGANLIISGDDLNDNAKLLLGISFNELGLSSDTCLSTYPKPSSINITHNYHEGTISYNIEYSTNKACGGGNYANISYNVEYPSPIFVEHTIPRTGVYIQDMGTVTAKKITINIEGKGYRGTDWTSVAFGGIVVPAGVSLPSEDPSDGFLCIQKNCTQNILEGTYSTTLGYICNRFC